MGTVVHPQKPGLKWRLLPVAGISLALAILGGTIALGTHQLRVKTRQQMIHREAEILHAVAMMQQLGIESAHEIGDHLEDFTDQLDVALRVSQLKGVIAARLYDAQGVFTMAFPPNVTSSRLATEDLEALRQLSPRGRFNASARLGDYFDAGTRTDSNPDESAPLLEIAIPFHRPDEPQLLGVAQFIIDGRAVAAEFASLDRNLWTQALVAFLAAGGLMAGTLSWAFRRLHRANRLLTERTHGLKRANGELAMAAKTSALGAVTAHLIHGLNNPLSGLQEFMASRNEEAEPDTEWQLAVASTRRMRELVENVTRVLAEEQAREHYEMTLEDLLQLVRRKSLPTAERAGVILRIQGTEPSRSLPNHVVNLIALILDNLIANAIEASAPGQEVSLRLTASEENLCCEVADDGPGIPLEKQKHLFRPGPSTKPGGSGIGLAICQQLAHHLGATLELTKSTPQGTLFALQVPWLARPTLHWEASREIVG